MRTLTVAEIVSMLCVSERTVQRWCSRDGLSHWRVRSRKNGKSMYVVQADELAKWAEKRRWMFYFSPTARQRIALYLGNVSQCADFPVAENGRIGENETSSCNLQGLWTESAYW